MNAKKFEFTVYFDAEQSNNRESETNFRYGFFVGDVLSDIYETYDSFSCEYWVDIKESTRYTKRDINALKSINDALQNKMDY